MNINIAGVPRGLKGKLHCVSVFSLQMEKHIIFLFWFLECEMHFIRLTCHF